MWVMINPQRRHLKVRKSAESQRVLDALYSYVEDNTNGPMKWLCSFWQDQQDSFGYEEIKQIVLDEVGPQSVFDRWFEDYSNFIREKMTPLWRQGIAAGAYSHPKIQELQAEGFSVATSSANVRNWLINRTGELVTNCTNNQIESIRYIIAEARSKGLSSDETARYIRPTIGLTRQQAGANLKLYESTKEQLRANHPRMTDESIERKARNVAAKDAAKKQRTRAVTIARTENAYAYNYGNDEAIRQAEAAGLMPHMVPYWSTAHSGNVCPVCEDLEGMAIDEGTGQFSTTWHDRDYTCELPPMHPRCMCAVEYREEVSEDATVSPSADTTSGNEEAEYADVTEDWTQDSDSDVTDATSFVYQGVKYQVDGKDIKVDYTPREKEVGEMLSRRSGKQVVMAPKIAGPYSNVHTPDFLLGPNREKWDLKEIRGSSKDAIRNIIHKKHKQADHFIIDVTNSPLDLSEVYRQSDVVFRAGNTRFVKELMIIRGNEILKVLRRK